MILTLLHNEAAELLAFACLILFAFILGLYELSDRLHGRSRARFDVYD